MSDSAAAPGSDDARREESSRGAREAIVQGRISLGIELGSTRIKLCLVGDGAAPVLAVGSHDWENELVDGVWTYALDAVWSGIQAAYAELTANVRREYGVGISRLGSLGVSAMMHGYLAFDSDGELLVPFRTWRNTSTGSASQELSALFGVNIPLRWSIAHLHQAVLDNEPHLDRLARITTLAGYVHARLTGRHVLGVGDASGVFPIDSETRTYNTTMLAKYAALVPQLHLEDLLPEVLVAGQPAGTLTQEGAGLLDRGGELQPGAVVAPPEGDAGTGMVATHAVAPRTGNVSAGTSIFAMVVLERPLAGAHHEIDLVTTPAGDAVAMVHCNNGASELAAWAGLFGSFAAASGTPLDADTVFEILFRSALEGDADAGGLLAFNHLAGEPIADLAEGRPLVVRAPDSRFTLPNFVRAQLYGMFGTLALGMRVLAGEGVELDGMFAHGGVFRTAGVAQRFLAAVLESPVSVAETASEGGAWGMAVLATFVREGSGQTLDTFLTRRIFADAVVETVSPDASDVAGFAAYLERYTAGLAIERVAVGAVEHRARQPEAAAGQS